MHDKLNEITLVLEWEGAVWRNGGRPITEATT